MSLKYMLPEMNTLEWPSQEEIAWILQTTSPAGDTSDPRGRVAGQLLMQCRGAAPWGSAAQTQSVRPGRVVRMAWSLKILHPAVQGNKFCSSGKARGFQFGWGKVWGEFL